MSTEGTPVSGGGSRHTPRLRAWRDRASASSVAAGAVSIGVIVAEGPPGSGYGWGSVVLSALILAGLFGGMAYLVRGDTPRRALAAVGFAVLVGAVVGASLVGNWGAESPASRVLDAASALVTVVACGAVVVVATATAFQHSGSSQARPLG